MSEKHNSKPCCRIYSKSTVSFHSLLRIYCVEVEPDIAAATNSYKSTELLSFSLSKKTESSPFCGETTKKKKNVIVRSISMRYCNLLNPQATQTKYSTGNEGESLKSTESCRNDFLEPKKNRSWSC